MITPLGTYHPAARATPTLVGREGPMEQIRRAVQERTDAVVFYVHGGGGIGKTRLLTEVLRSCREGVWQVKGKPLMAAEASVDLYHTQTHGLEGLVRATGAVLPSAREYFKNYGDELERLDRIKYDLRHALREMTELRDRVARVFIEDFQRLTQSHRVVMAFDTAEMLLYETDAVQQTLRLGAEGVGVRPWLINELLPALSNAVLLIAGRPREQLLKDLQNSLGDRLCVIELGQFSPDETQAYFKEIATAARADDEEEIAQRIETIPDDTRQVIHLYADGRPILLSLMIDLLALAERLPDEVKVPLAEAQEIAQSSEALQAIRDKLEMSIVSQFQRLGSPADEAIRSLAFARKGLDPTMLARVADMTESEARRILSALTGLPFIEGEPPVQNGWRPLSFIKVRPADKRVFLHDEMYALMERHALKNIPEPDVGRVYLALLGYYEEELEETNQLIKKLQPQVRQEISPDSRVITVPRLDMPSELQEERAKAEMHRDYFLTEAVHYWLRYKHLQGFQTYCRYAEAAYEASDASLDMQLRDELLAFINAPERKDLAEIDVLLRSEVDLDAGIRWIMRNIQHRLYDQAIVIANRLRTECADLLEKGGPLGKARLDLWEGVAWTYQGRNLEKGERLLRNAITVLRQLQSAKEDAFRHWQRNLGLANAYNGLGYALRQRGRYRQSIAAYRQALSLWRRLGADYNSQHANTLNNLSWALAELGDYDDALRLCKDGLDLRRALGSRYPIALSYNTLGQIQAKADQPHRARVNSEHALAILRELEMLRGIGMASIALAEARRRMSASGEVYFPDEQARLLWRAAQHANEAVSIFGGDMTLPEDERKPQVPEPVRLVDALIEQGCAYREWARLRPRYEQRLDDQGEPVTDPTPGELAQRGEHALIKAARLARSQQPHRAVDALVNLAWLKYFMDAPDEAQDALGQAWEIVPDSYYITKDRGRPAPEQDMPWHWVQLSKAHRLVGEIAYDRYEQENTRAKQAKERGDAAAAQTHLEDTHTHLRKVAVEYTLVEVYDELYGEGQIHRDQKRSEEQIYDRLKGLNVQELDLFRQAIQATAAEYQLGERPRMAVLLEKWFVPPEEIEM